MPSTTLSNWLFIEYSRKKCIQALSAFIYSLLTHTHVHASCLELNRGSSEILSWQQCFVTVSAIKAFQQVLLTCIKPERHYVTSKSKRERGRPKHRPLTTVFSYIKFCNMWRISVCHNVKCLQTAVIFLHVILALLVFPTVVWLNGSTRTFSPAFWVRVGRASHPNIRSEHPYFFIFNL